MFNWFRRHKENKQENQSPSIEPTTVETSTEKEEEVVVVAFYTFNTFLTKDERNYH